MEAFIKEKFTTVQHNALQPLGNDEFYGVIFMVMSKIPCEMPVSV